MIQPDRHNLRELSCNTPDDLMRIALAQINPTVADLQGNAARIVDFAHRARNEGADLAVFPELYVTGLSQFSKSYSLPDSKGSVRTMQ